MSTSSVLQFPLVAVVGERTHDSILVTAHGAERCVVPVNWHHALHPSGLRGVVEGVKIPNQHRTAIFFLRAGQQPDSKKELK